MRIRTVKPEFWTDEKTGPLGLLAKCLFVGMLNVSDDCGILKCSPEEWRVKIFPYQRDLSIKQICSALTEIWERNLVDIFALSSKPSCTYVFIRNFTKNQVVNRPSRPVIQDWRRGDTPRSYTEKHEVILKLFQPQEPPSMLTFRDTHGVLTEPTLTEYSVSPV